MSSTSLSGAPRGIFRAYKTFDFEHVEHSIDDECDGNPCGGGPDVGEWSPDEILSIDAKRRIQWELAELFRAPLMREVYFDAEENDISKLHVIIVGPRNTPFEGGYFYFLIRLPGRYPSVPPKVRFLTTDFGNVQFHPQIFETGDVILKLLGTAFGRISWDPDNHSVRQVILTLRSMFTRNPLRSGGDELPYESWNADAFKHETGRVAVCDAVRACVGNSHPAIAYLRQKIRQSF